MWDRPPGLSMRRPEACPYLIAEAAHFFPLFHDSLRLRSRSRRRRNRTNLHQFRTGLLFEHMLAVELRHARVFLRLLELRVARTDLLFPGVLGDTELIEIVLYFLSDNPFAQHQRVIFAVERPRFVAGEDFVAAFLFVPLSKCGRHVHLFDDIAPADTRVVSA